MTRLARTLMACAVVVALLGGCHHDEKAAGHGTVSGEILPGSISDAMLPYDTVKSKAPLAPLEQPGTSDGAPAGGAADSADTGAPVPDSSAPDAASSAATPAPAIVY